MPVSFSSVPNDWTMTVGVTHSYMEGNTQTWGVSATQSLEGGFDIKGISAKRTVSATVSYQYSTTYQTTLTQVKTQTHTYHLPAGQVWHFKFDFVDRCGLSSAGGYDYVVTNSQDEPPCCLPGYFANASVPHGACLPSKDGQTYDFCSAADERRNVLV